MSVIRDLPRLSKFARCARSRRPRRQESRALHNRRLTLSRLISELVYSCLKPLLSHPPRPPQALGATQVYWTLQVGRWRQWLDTKLAVPAIECMETTCGSTRVPRPAGAEKARKSHQPSLRARKTESERAARGGGVCCTLAVRPPRAGARGQQASGQRVPKQGGVGRGGRSGFITMLPLGAGGGGAWQRKRLLRGFRTRWRVAGSGCGWVGAAARGCAAGWRSVGAGGRVGPARTSGVGCTWCKQRGPDFSAGGPRVVWRRPALGRVWQSRPLVDGALCTLAHATTGNREVGKGWVQEGGRAGARVRASGACAERQIAERQCFASTGVAR